MLTHRRISVDTAILEVAIRKQSLLHRAIGITNTHLGSAAAAGYTTGYTINFDYPLQKFNMHPAVQTQGMLETNSHTQLLQDSCSPACRIQPR